MWKKPRAVTLKNLQTRQISRT